MSRRTKWIIGLASLIVLIIISLPVYYYWHDFHNNSRSTNPSDWGTFGDFFGGILNPIISFLTLVVTVVIALELKKIEDKNREREISASYQPQIVLEHSTFYTYPGKHYALKKPTEFSIERKGVEYESDLHSPNSFGVDVYNIGLGAAKDVEFTFSTEVTPMLELIADMSKSIPHDKRIEITLTKGKRYDNISINYPAYMGMSAPVMFLTTEPIKLTHILNVSVLDKSFLLRLPHFYLELYTVYQYTFHELMQVNVTERRDFPPMGVNIKYFDIGMKSFEKNFKISLLLSHGWVREFVNALMVEEI